MPKGLHDHQFPRGDLPGQISGKQKPQGGAHLRLEQGHVEMAQAVINSHRGGALKTAVMDDNLVVM
jgi:hypothetical protein